MDPRIKATLDLFTPLSLDELNAKAAMLERLDNKYILPASRFRPALEAFAAHFDVLQIDGKRAFTYATTYYDDPALHGYYDHHQGRRKRCKVRVRNYVDAGFSYLEVKLKDKRQVTIKKRLKLDTPENGVDENGMAFVETCHSDLYEEPFDKPLAPVIGMEYERITLVAKQGGERMTIDTALQFAAANVTRVVRPDMFVIETKSARGNGIADKILRSMHMHPTSRCSKYCIGMAATGQVARRNRFLPALRRLDLLAPAQTD
ncbi:polyphosphate polymerase domain-containing protein [Yoonia sp.]|uniref:polyphosphate polymerase domain-containing protein n=1 Tax=Yoonia sp. TaxID=2212373 RepID=UPI0019F7BAE3|nr:polyphosphate polymerase domain-containing protein [Yoonia sp.]MBE0414394.1 polyphosphate polymerase domain-containing protein [Yoonia sp.]